MPTSSDRTDILLRYYQMKHLKKKKQYAYNLSLRDLFWSKCSTFNWFSLCKNVPLRNSGKNKLTVDSQYSGVHTTFYARMHFNQTFPVLENGLFFLDLCKKRPDFRKFFSFNLLKMKWKWHEHFLHEPFQLQSFKVFTTSKIKYSKNDLANAKNSNNKRTYKITYITWFLNSLIFIIFRPYYIIQHNIMLQV